MHPCKPKRIHSWLRAGAGFLFLTLQAATHADTFLAVTPYTPGDDPAAWQWMFTEEDGPTAYNPTLVVNTGSPYDFSILSDSMHPEQTHTFWIDKSPGLGGIDPYDAGITNNGVESGGGIVKMNLPADAPDLLYYSCGDHSAMAGLIVVQHDLVFRSGFD